MDRRRFLGVAAGAGLIAGATVVRPSLGAGADRRTIRGRVSGDGRPLVGVLVSDGCRVVCTDAQGRYELAIGPDSGRFVFVTTPAGYWAEVFYRPIQAAAQTAQADFLLRPIAQPERFDFVFITDMHLENRPWGVVKTQASIREINDLTPTPALLWAQGDICLQGHAGSAYRECLALAKMPVRNGPGNHEMILEHANPRDEFEAVFGPTYYSFDWAGIHGIVLDGNKPIPGQRGFKAVHGAVEGSELAWLRADLAAQPLGKPIIVGIHIPIVSTYPQRRRESPKDAPYWEVTNADALTDLFAQHKVRLVLQGHMHENERIVVKGVEYVESISLSGCWFQSGAAMERGVDGTPRGYRIISVDGKTVTHRYYSSCESHVDRQYEFAGLGQRVASGKDLTLLLNCYDAPHGSTGQARLDGGPWRPMPAAEPINESIGLKMPHHFGCRIEAAALRPGPHAVEARIIWPDGTVVIGSATFLASSES